MAESVSYVSYDSSGSEVGDGGNVGIGIRIVVSQGSSCSRYEEEIFDGCDDDGCGLLHPYESEGTEVVATTHQPNNSAENTEEQTYCWDDVIHNSRLVLLMRSITLSTNFFA